VGLRLDVALVAALERIGVPVSRSRLRKAFDAGAVRADGKPAAPGRVVDAPMLVEVEVPELPVLVAVPEPIPLHAVYEDEALLVVDKPAPMVVHPSVGHECGTLVGAVLHHLGVEGSALPVLPGNDATRPGIVHRLDRDTSGLIVLVKTAAAQTFLARQFEAHTIERSYLGVVEGVPTWTRRNLDTTHARDPADRRRFAPVDVPSARRAVTGFEVLEALDSAALVRATLHTGRTHQIRMHARMLGHPIFGDDLYGRAPKDPHHRALWTSLPRHALHAEVLAFDHPSGGRMRFTSPLPDVLADLVAALRQ
jgi:23S rRNA pseudouridine1911/1915/1917 synthase